MAPVAPGMRRNWAGVIAVPAVAIVALTLALVATRPTPLDPNGAYLTSVDQYRSYPYLSPVPPTPSPALTPEVSAERRCNTPVGRAPAYPVPSRSGFSMPIVRQALSVPPCRAVVLGTTAAVSLYPGQLVEVTATPAMDPAVQPAASALPDGRYRVSFRLHLRNVGTASMPTPFTFVWAADTRLGWTPAAASSEGYRGLSPGEEADQFVAFDVSGSGRLARLRLSLDPGSVTQTVDWVIG